MQEDRLLKGGGSLLLPVAGHSSCHNGKGGEAIYVYFSGAYFIARIWNACGIHYVR